MPFVDWYRLEMVNVVEVKKEYEKILQQLRDSELISNWEWLEELTKRKNFLEKIMGKEEELTNIKNQIQENQTILKAKEDPQLLSLAEEENVRLKEKEKRLEKEMQDLLKGENGEEKIGSVIVEIRAGTGGKEAALFAQDLFRMYSKYAQSQGWKQKILDSRLSELSGFKTITFEISNSNVFLKMKWEGGVHRIQRIPQTEKSGRIHTSTATVAVLPKPKKTKMKINPQDLRIDTYRASGPGGQYVNRRETAVRITHLPSGIVVTSQAERSQLQNKENALSILGAKLLEKQEQGAEEKIHGERKAQIGWAKRAEKIRTYNMPQDRLTDHRIKKSWKNLAKIFAGDLGQIIETLNQSRAHGL